MGLKSRALSGQKMESRLRKNNTGHYFQESLQAAYLVLTDKTWKDLSYGLFVIVFPLVLLPTCDISLCSLSTLAEFLSSVSASSTWPTLDLDFIGSSLSLYSLQLADPML